MRSRPGPAFCGGAGRSLVLCHTHHVLPTGYRYEEAEEEGAVANGGGEEDISASGEEAYGDEGHAMGMSGGMMVTASY